MTTNDRDVLDPAMVRPGRADLDIKIGLMGTQQTERLVSSITGTVWRTPLRLSDVSPAAMVNAMKENIGDPVGQAVAATRYLNGLRR